MEHQQRRNDGRVLLQQPPSSMIGAGIAARLLNMYIFEISRHTCTVTIPAAALS